MSPEKSGSQCTPTTHEFLCSEPDMHGLFVARGPHLQAGVRHSAFSSVHLYALLAELLQITPAEQSGNLAKTETMLVPGRGQNGRLSDGNG
ncbi:MAG: hypothetical protein ACI8PZ_007300 [Myxococcota bacterium]